MFKTGDLVNVLGKDNYSKRCAYKVEGVLNSKTPRVRVKDDNGKAWLLRLDQVKSATQGTYQVIL